MANGIDPRTMAMLGAAGGLLGASGWSARPISMGEAMGQGLQGGLLGYQQGQQMQRQQEAMDMVKAQREMQQRQMERQSEIQQKSADIAQQTGGGGRGYAQALIASGIPELIEQGLRIQPKVKSSKTVMTPEGPRELPMFETGEFGEASPYATAQKLQALNLGGAQAMVDPYTGQPVAQHRVSMSPGEQARLAQAQAQMAQSQAQFGAQHGLAQQRLAMDMANAQRQADPSYQMSLLGQKEATKLAAKSQFEAAQALPDMESTLKSTEQMVQGLIDHPGFNVSVGVNAPLGFAASKIPGTPAADWRAMYEQFSGQQFLNAFQQLKGGGAITEAEGEKATQAMHRMRTTVSEKEFKNAGRELVDTIRSGVDRMRKKAGQQAQQPMQLPGGFTYLGAE